MDLQNEIDFEDSTTVEFLFKEYWIMLKLNCGYKLPSFFSGSYLGNNADPHPVLANSLQKEHVNGIRELNCFSRSQLLQLLDDPFKLTAAIVGGFVRVRVINKEGNSHHRLVQVIGKMNNFAQSFTSPLRFLLGFGQAFLKVLYIPPCTPSIAICNAGM